MNKNNNSNNSDSGLNLYKIEYIAKKKVTGFFDFIKNHGVMGLAIGFMLGDKIKNLANSLVMDILNPLLMTFTGTAGNLNDSKVNFFGAELLWGKFTLSFLDFLFMAFVIYIIFKSLGLDKLEKSSETSQ